MSTPITDADALTAHLRAGGTCVLMEAFAGQGDIWCDATTNQPIRKLLVRRCAESGRLTPGEPNPFTGEVTAYTLNPDWKPKAKRVKKRGPHDLGPAPLTVKGISGKVGGWSGFTTA